MALLFDPTSTSQYTGQMLQGGQGQWTPAQVQQMQQAGITMSDLQSLNLLGPPQMNTPGQNWTSGGQSGVGGGGTIGGQVVDPASAQRQAQNATLLKLILAGGGQQQQGPPTPGNAYGQAYPLYAQDAQGNPTGKPIYANPTNQASLLGAAALGIGGGESPVVINQPPSSALDPRSGVSKVGGALIGTATPQMGWNWDTLAHAAGLDSPAIAAYAKAGYTPDTLGKKLGLGSGATPGMAGPWMNTQTGSVFTPVARTAPTQVTPLTSATQAPATAYNPTPTPFAQAPPAPGLQIPQTPFLAAHTDALANAGKALFAHFGGDPNSAGPADIANFHNQLTSTLAAASQPTAAKKMQSGGMVPGRGNKDSVPALLTPGEYVIPKQDVNQLMRTGRLPIKMADGGTVPDGDQNAPPEARRKMLSAQTSQAQPPAAPGGSSIHPALASGLATAAQTYGSSMANFPKNPIGSGSGVDIRNTRLDPDPDLPSLKAAGMLGGGAGSGQPTANVLSGIGSGLTQAAKDIASSVKPWQMQSYQQPFGSGVAPAPQVAFQAPPAPSQATQQGVNPYAAYAANQARYPTSPYYS